MLEESVPGVWASMHGWFTPAMLFVLVNLVIGTIAVASTMGQKEHKKLARAPSAVERLRSFSIFRQTTQEIPPMTTTVTDVPEEETATVEDEVQVHDDNNEHPFFRSRSETQPDSGFAKLEMLSEKLKKSASAKSVLNHFEAEEIPIPTPVPRPSTVRARKTHHFEEHGVDESGPAEVDAKADDFINRFKQNLKLERLESIIRYKDMLNRGK